MRVTASVSLAVLLLFPISTTLGEEQRADTTVKVTVDTSEVPDLAAWANKAKSLIEAWHPRIAALLPSDGFSPPTEIKVLFKKDMRGIAATSGTTISIAATWVRQHPDDYGMVIHELTHAIQAYPNGSTGWLVEGIADYIRYFHFEPQLKLGGIDPARQSYRDGYRTTALFLAWIEQTHDKAIVRKLNETLRTGRYRYALFRQYTGKSLDRLWADFLESDASQGRG